MFNYAMLMGISYGAADAGRHQFYIDCSIPAFLEASLRKFVIQTYNSWIIFRKWQYLKK